MNGQKILVLGDERHLFRTICWVLEYKGYYVRITPRPEAALALLIEQDFDLIIAKLHMEDLQSLDVLERAKKLNPEIKIIVVSGDGNAAFPLEAFQIEVDDYLLLPISPSELIRRVGRCLEKVVAIKTAQAASVKREALINQKLSSQIMIMVHDIRNGLVSTAASLKLLKQGKYGAMDSRLAEKVQGLFDCLQNSTTPLDAFAKEMLSGLVQTAVIHRKMALRPKPVLPVPETNIPDLPPAC